MTRMTRLVISAALRAICPLALGMIAGNTVKVFGMEILWRVIVMCILASGGAIGLYMSVQDY